MNKLQKVEFNILKTVIGICEKLDIKYFLVCGSSLGAVKYKGFIPWDDDIDIALFREDYDKFCDLAQELLPEYYFLQNYKTDKYFPAIYSKVRDSRTTFIENSVSELNINHGVYIDIFPLDGYPAKRSILFEVKKYIFKCMLFCSFKKEAEFSTKSKILYSLGRFFRFHKISNKIVDKYSRFIANYPTKESELICNHGNWQGKLEYAPDWHYGKGAWVTFEGIEVRIPECYDEYLTQKYGDWRDDPPKEKRVGHHYYSICDLDRPYTEYIK